MKTIISKQLHAEAICRQLMAESAPPDLIPGTAASDYFGQSIALSETHLAVSAYFEDEAAGVDSGKVYVYETTNWTLVRTIDNPNAISTPYMDNFGFRVALYGQKLAVCGTNFDRAAEPDNSGPVYVFTLD